LIGLYVVIAPLAGFIGKFMEPVRELDVLTSPSALFTLWNALAVGVFAGSLGLADWAARSFVS
jgi:ApbE superfamily uncharacterized protein (UPF0280 family)